MQMRSWLTNFVCAHEVLQLSPECISHALDAAQAAALGEFAGARTSVDRMLAVVDIRDPPACASRAFNLYPHVHICTRSVPLAAVQTESTTGLRQESLGGDVLYAQTHVRTRRVQPAIEGISAPTCESVIPYLIPAGSPGLGREGTSAPTYRRTSRIASAA
ncbi:hypothetical protein BKA93DRAFT_324017 [Sparassis latifolia]